MKLISSDNAKTLVILTALGAGGYVLWKLFSAGASIKDTVSNTVEKIGDAARSAYHSADLAATRVSVAASQAAGVAPDYGADQTDAETARLARMEAGTPAQAPTVGSVLTAPFRAGAAAGGAITRAVIGEQTSSYDQSPVDIDPQTALG